MQGGLGGNENCNEGDEIYNEGDENCKRLAAKKYKQFRHFNTQAFLFLLSNYHYVSLQV